MELQKTRRRWFQFSLRTLLILVTLITVLGWVGLELDQRRREKETIAWVETMGGEVYFYSGYDTIGMSFFDDIGWWDETKDKWFGERVMGVNLDNMLVSDLSPLAELKNLHELHLSDLQASDLWLLSKSEMKKRITKRRTLNPIT